MPGLVLSLSARRRLRLLSGRRLHHHHKLHKSTKIMPKKSSSSIELALRHLHIDPGRLQDDSDYYRSFQQFIARGLVHAMFQIQLLDMSLHALEIRHDRAISSGHLMYAKSLQLRYQISLCLRHSYRDVIEDRVALLCAVSPPNSDDGTFSITVPGPGRDKTLVLQLRSTAVFAV